MEVSWRLASAGMEGRNCNVVFGPLFYRKGEKVLREESVQRTAAKPASGIHRTAVAGPWPHENGLTVLTEGSSHPC